MKKSFLIAVLMFLEAITATGKAQGLQLRMKAPLVECLIVSPLLTTHGKH